MVTVTLVLNRGDWSLIENPVIAASVDGEVTDVTNKFHPIGNSEVKYKLFPATIQKNMNKDTNLLEIMVQGSKSFCLENAENGLKLKKKHKYFAQIQGVWQ